MADSHSNSSAAVSPVGGVEFRALAADDLDAARALWSAAEGVELAEGDELDSLRAYLKRNPAISQGAWRHGKLVGALLAGHDGRRGMLYHLAVSAECRGRGVGRELVRHALDRLRREGILRVVILVARDNPGGRAFWQRMGWEPLAFAEPMAIDL